MSSFLPSEPEILEARRSFPDAQSALDDGVGEKVADGPFALGWYGTSVSRERGAFAVVADRGLLSDLIGDRVRIVYDTASVVAYVFGGAVFDTCDIAVTRRAFAALELLVVERIDVEIEVLSS